MAFMGLSGLWGLKGEPPASPAHMGRAGRTGSRLSVKIIGPGCGFPQGYGPVVCGLGARVRHRAAPNRYDITGNGSPDVV